MDNLIDAKMMAAKRAIRFFVLTPIVCLILNPVLFANPRSAPPCLNVQIQDNAAKQGQKAGRVPIQTTGQQLEADQKRLSEQYRQLEEKLFSLHEFEKGKNLIRSKLLERAFVQSQEKMTADQMKLIVRLLARSNLKDAETEQALVLEQLNALLSLLQSEDRGKRVRDDIQRHQEYLKEVERILRIQKGIRGQAEGNADQNRLVNSEIKTADRTKKLATKILENEASKDEDQNPPEKASDGSRPDLNPSGKKESENRQSDNSNEGGKKFNKEPGQPGDPGEGSQSREPTPNENSTQDRVESAEKKMREAQQKLETSQRDEAIDAMKQAEREIALAKQQLEEILRQLREEEVERSLALLEARFRQMLEHQVRVRESTGKLDLVVSEQRGTDFEIRAGRLAVDQNSIAADAARALLLLREDGTSVAFPAAVDEMHQDMLQVASRLSAAKVGRITLEIETDVIDTLNYLVESLVKTQQDIERMKQQPQTGKTGPPGDKPLVDELAEIKMLREMQERILRRHRRYAAFLDDPEDPVGATDDLELQAALRRLSVKQSKLTEIARDIVNEKNK